MAETENTTPSVVLLQGKAKLDRLLSKAVDACNHLIKYGDLIDQPLVRKLWCRTSSLTRDLIQVCVDFPLVQAYRIWDQRTEIIFIGSNFGAITVAEFFPFDEKPEIAHLCSLFVWNLPQKILEWFKTENRIVMSDLNRRLFPTLRISPRFDVVVLVDQVLELNDWLNNKSKEFKSYLNRKNKEEITYRFSQKAEDFELFYQRVYVPYMEYRSGPINSFSELKQRFQKGGVLFIDSHDQNVAVSIRLTR